MNKLLVGAVAAGMLTSATVLGSGVAAGDTALIVPGTEPSPYPPLRAFYHFTSAMQPAIGEKYYNSAGATREVVPYPGSLWPVTGLNSPTVGESVAEGTNNLDAAIRNTDGPIAVTGLSQGTLALDGEQARLVNDPNAPPSSQVTFIKAGDPNRLLARMFKPGTHVPVIDYTIPAPVESQYNTIDLVGQYDMFSDPPDRPGNLLADLNAIMAGGYYGHTATAFSDPARVAPWDVTTTTNSLGATTTTYFIRTDGLPLVRALVDIAGLPPEAAGPLNAVLTPMVDAAYTRNGPSPASGLNPTALVNAVRHVPAIAPAISIPVESTTAGTSAATTATNAVSGVNAATNVASGVNPAKGAKGVLTKVSGLLPKRKH
ncbi:MAG TPA: PE-PPE domain-containing protein [Mycobacterium sp.]|nr:PE-PPE domain-containing protein [Mycobacterium sp.]